MRSLRVAILDEAPPARATIPALGIIALTLVATVLAASAASAQSVRYRRPYNEGYRLNYGFDHAGAGCVDYACGGACYNGHTGSDFGTPYGTTVVAAAAGVVSATNDGCADYGSFGNTCGGRCGNYVQIRHSDGSVSIYCHMRRGSLRVGTGASVSCGQALGQSASSGSSTGPHLHFGHRSPGASSSDPFAGNCSRATSLWTAQAGYREPVGTSCSGGGCTPSGESCNGRDDDCDGRVDEGLARGCGTDVGECVAGTQYCEGGGWGACRGEVPPRAEACNGRDDDCDGASDESLQRACGTDVGECVAGVQTCVSAAWGACEGEVPPAPEVCDRLDNDCDGTEDDEQICEREELAWIGPLLSPWAESDADGDGRADGCARSGPGFSCLLASERGFARVMGGPPIDAAHGFDELFRAATIRMADLDGDGRADLCARDGDALACWRSDGRAFDETIAGPPWEDGVSLLELADVNGDGRLDACARDAEGLRCHLGEERGFGHVVVLAALSDEAGFADVVHHGSIRFGDVDGDGRDDVCARGPDGLDCWPSDGERFGERMLGPRWSDAAGFDALSRWSTIRLADIDADGDADVCARTPEGFRCATPEGRRFGNLVEGPAMRAEDGWDRPAQYATIRMGDVDGDDRADLCARDAEGIRCWIASGRGLDRLVVGPALSDAAGWDAPARFRSIRLVDVDGDGRADLCGRDADGLRCSLSTGAGFDRTWLALSWSDAESELDTLPGLVSIRLAGGGLGVAAATTGGRVREGAGTDGGCAIAPSASRAPGLLFIAALALLVRRRRF